MATLPSQDSYTAGVPVTAPVLNSNIRDAINFLLAPPGVQLTRSAAWTLASNSNPQLISQWDTQILDSDSMWASSPTPSRIYATTAGLYEFSLFVHYPAALNGATGICHCGLQLNAGGRAWAEAPDYRIAEDVRPINNSKTPNYGTSADLVVEQAMSAGDYVEFYTCQSSGSTATMGTGTFNIFCAARWVARS